MTTGYVRQCFPADGIPPAGDQFLGLEGKSSLGDVLTALEQLDISNLQMRWRELFGRNAPARLGVDLLRAVDLDASAPARTILLHHVVDLGPARSAVRFGAAAYDTPWRYSLQNER